MSAIFLNDRLWRSGWDGLVAVTVFISAILLPYRVVSAGNPFSVFYWIATVVLVLDVLANFIPVMDSGVEPSHDHELRYARRYLRTWLIPDLLAALPLAAIAQPFLPDGSLVLPAGRILLFLRLLRLLKLPVTFKQMRERLAVPAALMRLLSFLFGFALVTHFMALGWIAIGAVDLPLRFADRYLRALYWCITTITTIGYGDYGPDHNSNIQILYTIGVQLIGVGMFTYIIGNVATLVVNLDSARAAFDARLDEVCEGMRSRRLPDGLQKRVKNYYRYLWETRKGVSNSEFMEDLPETLRLDIAMHQNRAILKKVDIFRDGGEAFERAMISRLEPVVFLPGDFIIRQGERGRCMYFVSRGEVEVLVDSKTVARLPEGAVFGEAALIKGEARNASIRAVAYCDAYRLDKPEFDALRSEFPAFDHKVQAVMSERLGKSRPAAEVCV